MYFGRSSFVYGIDLYTCTDRKLILHTQILIKEDYKLNFFRWNSKLNLLQKKLDTKIGQKVVPDCEMISLNQPSLLFSSAFLKRNRFF